MLIVVISKCITSFEIISNHLRGYRLSAVSNKLNHMDWTGCLPQCISFSRQSAILSGLSRLPILWQAEIKCNIVKYVAR